MTKNQIAMRNLARGSVRAKIGKESLTPRNRERLAGGALQHWQDLDNARLAKYRRRRIDRDRKESESSGRTFHSSSETPRTTESTGPVNTSSLPVVSDDKIAKVKVTKAKTPKSEAKVPEVVVKPATDKPAKPKAAPKPRAAKPKVEKSE